MPAYDFVLLIRSVNRHAPCVYHAHWVPDWTKSTVYDMYSTYAFFVVMLTFQLNSEELYALTVLLDEPRP